ncbi:helix-turn-helix domain-containing protein [Streptomyces sp. 135]|uniref:GlxA family transcriptional regulator n=1 Tax=Streptomyces sp. 135 TaxID=2838850 RepID=UPI001CBCDD06|nr:helix-turn-helix domain-containing protein [Streptomyces sp. 135]
MHKVAILILDQIVALDMAAAIEVFGHVRLSDGRPAYHVRVCAEEPEVNAGGFSLHAPWGLDTVAEADTVIIPSTSLAHPLTAAVSAAVSRAASRGARIACVSPDGRANPLASVGPVGRPLFTPDPAAVGAAPQTLYIDKGQALTSTGSANCWELCLHLVHRDHGPEVAAAVAHEAVLPDAAPKNQAGFVGQSRPPASEDSTFDKLLLWLQENLTRHLSVADVAARAGVSPRTLTRRFHDRTGITPLQWLHRARISRAQCLLETTSYSVERIASDVGFASLTAFRDRFKEATGFSPHAYRRASASSASPLPN